MQEHELLLTRMEPAALIPYADCLERADNVEAMRGCTAALPQIPRQTRADCERLATRLRGLFTGPDGELLPDYAWLAEPESFLEHCTDEDGAGEIFMPGGGRNYRCVGILLSALTAASPGCAVRAATATPTTWTPETLAIGPLSLEVPSMWTLSEAAGSAMLTPRPPDADDVAVLVTPGRPGLAAIDTARSLLPLRDVKLASAPGGPRKISGSAVLDGIGAVQFEAFEVGSKEVLVLLAVQRAAASADHVAALRRIIASARAEE